MLWVSKPEDLFDLFQQILSPSTIEYTNMHKCCSGEKVHKVNSVPLRVILPKHQELTRMALPFKMDFSSMIFGPQ